MIQYNINNNYPKNNEDLFITATQLIRNIKSRPSNEELLKLYGLYKQATIGNNLTNKPSVFNIKEKAKWDSWNNEKNKSQDKAKQEYIDLVNILIKKY